METKLGIGQEFQIFVGNFKRLEIIKSPLDSNLYKYLANSYYRGYEVREDYSVSIVVENEQKFNVEPDELSFTSLGLEFIRSCK